MMVVEFLLIYLYNKKVDDKILVILLWEKQRNFSLWRDNFYHLKFLLLYISTEL